jgi:hypothetical protein
MLRGILVPKGTHKVVFYYASAGFLTGSVITIGAVCLFALGCWRRRALERWWLRAANGCGWLARPICTWQSRRKISIALFIVVAALTLVCALAPRNAPLNRLCVQKYDAPSYDCLSPTSVPRRLKPDDAFIMQASFTRNATYLMQLTAWATNDAAFRAGLATPSLLFDCMHPEWDTEDAEIMTHLTGHPRSFTKFFRTGNDQSNAYIRLINASVSNTVLVSKARVSPVSTGDVILSAAQTNLSPWYAGCLCVLCGGLLYLVASRR